MSDSSDSVEEQLSALVDDQLPAHEQELLVARLTRDKGLIGCWGRYHLISDALRQQLPGRHLVDISGRVCQALQAESALSVKSRQLNNNWLKPLAGLAIAASVAVVAILGVQNLHLSGDSPAVVASAGNVPAVIAKEDQIVRVRGIRWNRSAPQVADRLNRYLVDHSEYAASGGMPGIGPHVRIVGYDTSR